jgi:CHAD domain-containing protein
MEEIEWQFEAHDLRPVVRWLDARRPAAEIPHEVAALVSDGPPDGQPVMAVVPREPRSLVDTYVDTEDWRFHRAGLAARLRASDGEFEGTLKTLVPAEDALRVRTEIGSPLTSSEPEALLAAESRAGSWVRSLVGAKPLRPLFTLRTHRQPYGLLIDGVPAGEVVLDETTIETSGASEPVRLKRVEVEIEAASVERARPFVDDLRTACWLTPASASKFEVGLLAIGLAPQGLPDAGPVSLPEAPSMGQLAYAVVRRSFLAFLQSEPTARVGEDPEGVHDMRVAIRRMRAALRLFEPALSRRAPRLRAELRWVGSQLGEVRDLDIQLGWIKAWADEGTTLDTSALAHLLAGLERQRDRARTKMLRCLDSKRYERLVARLTAVLRAGPPRRSPAARAPALSAFPELIEQRQRRARKAGKKLRDDSPPDAFHRMRIQCKRLRYAVESGRDLYTTRAEAYADVIVRLQDILGQHQDAVVAVSHLQKILDRSNRRMPPGVAFLMGRMSQRYEQEAARLRRRFRRAYPALRGKAWSRLQRAMERGLGAGAVIPWPPRTAAPPPPDAAGEG